jgi:ribonuclease P protein component
VLPERNRLRRRAQFAEAVRRGRRVGKRDVVVHLLFRREADGPADPRIGLIVSKAVGDAVVRHRVSRRLRHVCAGLLGESATLEALESFDIVIRALPGAAQADSAALGAQLRSAVRRLTEEVKGCANKRSE